MIVQLKDNLSCQVQVEGDKLVVVLITFNGQIYIVDKLTQEQKKALYDGVVATVNESGIEPPNFLLKALI